MKNKAGWFATVGILAWGSVPGPIVYAQEGDGFSYSFSINQRLTANDNLGFDAVSDGTSVTSNTALGFDLRSETPNQMFNFSLGTTLEGGYFASDDDVNIDFGSPRAALTYSRENRSSVFSANASIRRDEISSLVLSPLIFDPDGDDEGASEGGDPTGSTDPGFTEDDLIVDDGTRVRSNVGVGLTTGRDGPLRFSFRLDRSSTEYSGTTDPELTDNRTLSGSARATAVINPTMTASVFVNKSQFEDDNAGSREVQRKSVGASLSYTISPTTSLSANVSANRVEETEFAVTSVTEGAGFGLSLQNERPNGQIGLSFDRSISVNGANDSVELSRSLDLPDGALSVAVGLVNGAASDTQTTANLNYRKDFATGSLSASLGQSLSTDDDDDVLRTRISVNVNKSINSVSSVGAGFNVADSNNLGAGMDTRRTEFSVTYNRSLTQDWSLQSGYSYRMSQEDGAADRTSNAVFVGVGRTFNFR